MSLPVYEQHILDLHGHLACFEAYMALNQRARAETCISLAEDCLVAAKRKGAPFTALLPWRRAIGDALMRCTQRKEAA